MRSIMHALMLAVVGNMAVATPSVTLAAPAATAAKTKSVYKVDATDLGTLLDDPASKAILIKHIPDVVSNPQIAMGRAMTLSQLAQYAPAFCVELTSALQNWLVGSRMNTH